VKEPNQTMPSPLDGGIRISERVCVRTHGLRAALLDGQVRTVVCRDRVSNVCTPLGYDEGGIALALGQANDSARVLQRARDLPNGTASTHC
jgi:hypothetical protein